MLNEKDKLRKSRVQVMPGYLTLFHPLCNAVFSANSKHHSTFTERFSMDFFLRLMDALFQ